MLKILFFFSLTKEEEELLLLFSSLLSCHCFVSASFIFFYLFIFEKKTFAATASCCFGCQAEKCHKFSRKCATLKHNRGFNGPNRWLPKWIPILPPCDLWQSRRRASIVDGEQRRNQAAAVSWLRCLIRVRLHFNHLQPKVAPRLLAGRTRRRPPLLDLIQLKKKRVGLVI